jgi:hypothetical protein
MPRSGHEEKRAGYRLQSYTEVTQSGMKRDVRTGIDAMIKAYLACANGKLLVTTDPLADPYVTPEAHCVTALTTALGSVLLTALPLTAFVPIC